MEEHFGEGEPALLSARQDAHLLEDVVPAEKETAEERAETAADVSRRDLLDRLENVVCRIQLFGLVLGKIGDRHVVADHALPRIERFNSREYSRECGFPRTVDTDERDPVAPVDVEADPVENFQTAVALPDPFQFHDHAPGLGGGREGKVYPPLLVFDLDQIEFLELLDPALHLARLGGFVPEALDELLRLLDLLLLVPLCRDLLRSPYGLFRDVVCEVPRIFRERSHAQFVCLAGHVVEEAAVV